MWGNHSRRYRTEELRFTGLPFRQLLARPGSQPVTSWPVTALIGLLGFLLCCRLFQLTVVEGAWFRAQADENRILSLPVMAQRGVLLDRNGSPLTRNVPLYRRQVPGTNPAELRFEPVNRETALSLLTNPTERISYDVSREYPCGQACAAAVGYMSEVTPSDITEANDYRNGELIGKTGAEKAYERLLRGIPGQEYLEINAKGNAVRTVGMKEAQSGTSVKLTIDQGLTQLLYQAFAGRPGAAVAVAPATGDILAMVSSPTFDPGNVSQSLQQPNLPFFNRAMSGTYAPGSTFKIVTAIAALEENAITPDTRFQDTGELTVGEYQFGNWLWEEHGRTEGEVNVVKALARSNDIFFYKAGEVTGAAKLADWAGLLGFGKTWGLKAWGEAGGLVPSPEWKLTNRQERWYLGNTYHMSIGQGDVLATPLQVALMTAAIGNKGVLCPPHFDLKDKPPACQQLNLKESTLAIVRQGMTEACEPGGTGVAFFDFEPRVACKTGTAQQGGEKELPHAWFTVFAPADRPTIALSVLVEKGGQGSEVAAPIARQAVEYWLNR